MHRQMILAAFAKARKEEIEEFGTQASTSRAAQRISAFIANHSAVPYGAKMLRIGYKNASIESATVEIKQPQVLRALSLYVGFDTYKEYIIGQEIKKAVTTSSVRASDHSLHKRDKWILVLTFSVVITIILYPLRYKERWMVWNTDRYVEVGFDPQSFQDGLLLRHEEKSIENFKKVTLSCDSVFFTADGKSRFWYGRNRHKELEYFTDLAKHPITGKALKPLSRYMISKYICKD